MLLAELIIVTSYFISYMINHISKYLIGGEKTVKSD